MRKIRKDRVWLHVTVGNPEGVVLFTTYIMLEENGFNNNKTTDQNGFVEIKLIEIERDDF